MGKFNTIGAQRVDLLGYFSKTGEDAAGTCRANSDRTQRGDAEALLLARVYTQDRQKIKRFAKIYP